jgi:hypothetical protein
MRTPKLLVGELLLYSAGVLLTFSWLTPMVRADGSGPVSVLTWHNDAAHTGRNLQETALTLANVSTDSFGLLFYYPVDGYVYAQPLVLTGVNVPGRGLRNLVFVATEHDSVYAFDADDPGGSILPIWQAAFAKPAADITSVPGTDLSLTEPPELGITGTPVIDPATGTLYVVSHTKEVTAAGPTYVHRLHALDVASGVEKFGGPVVMQGSVPGSGTNGDASGQVEFDTQYGFQRPGLTLVNGVVYAAFASGGDVGPYHGWIFGYDAHTLHQVLLYNDTPNSYEGGIWMSGASPAVDAQGDLFVLTGNGGFDPTQNNYGDSILRLTPTGTNLVVADYFTPFDQEVLDEGDGDLGSGGPMLLPDEAGSAAHPHLMLGCGKEGTIYLLDRDNMGHFHDGSDSQIVQSLVHVIPGTWGSPAYYGGLVYYQGFKDALKAFSISQGLLSTAPVMSNSASVWGYPGGTPSISASGTNNAILWLVQTDTFYDQLPAILHAYNATNLEQEVYNSNQAGPRDQPGLAQKFAVPVVANGKVYLGTGGRLAVYGLTGAPQIFQTSPSQAVVPGTTVTLWAGAAGSSPMAYQWQLAGNPVPGATGPYLTVTNATSDQSGDYSVTVTNLAGSAVSLPVTLIVSDPPTLGIDSDQQLSLTGLAGVSYQIQSLTAPGTGWQPVTQVTVPPVTSGSSTVNFNDPAGSADPVRLYRAVVMPVPLATSAE